MRKKIKELRNKWELTGAKKLDLKSRPPDDVADNDNLLSINERYDNIKINMLNLAKVMSVLFDIYRTDKSLYGDRFLAFVGNEFLKNWPWKDFQFTSVKAHNLMGTNTTGKYNFELPANVVLSGITYEHWTPVSFFRDVFDLGNNLTVNDFYELLINYYRIVRITKNEDQQLNNLGFKSCRPVTAYADAGIEIFEIDLWNRFYSF